MTSAELIGAIPMPDPAHQYLGVTAQCLCSAPLFATFALLSTALLLASTQYNAPTVPRRSKPWLNSTAPLLFRSFPRCAFASPDIAFATQGFASTAPNGAKHQPHRSTPNHASPYQTFAAQCLTIAFRHKATLCQRYALLISAIASLNSSLT